MTQFIKPRKRFRAQNIFQLDRYENWHRQTQTTTQCDNFYRRWAINSVSFPRKKILHKMEKSDMKARDNHEIFSAESSKKGLIIYLFFHFHTWEMSEVEKKKKSVFHVLCRLQHRPKCLIVKLVVFFLFSPPSNLICLSTVSSCVSIYLDDIRLDCRWLNDTSALSDFSVIFALFINPTAKVSSRSGLRLISPRLHKFFLSLI